MAPSRSRERTAVTAVGWDRDDDGCNGPCCTEPDRRPARPTRIRLRLAVHRRIDRVGAWLCGHHCTRVALWMWRACRMI